MPGIVVEAIAKNKTRRQVLILQEILLPLNDKTGQYYGWLVLYQYGKGHHVCHVTLKGEIAWDKALTSVYADSKKEVEEFMASLK